MQTNADSASAYGTLLFIAHGAKATGFVSSIDWKEIGKVFSFNPYAQVKLTCKAVSIANKWL